MIPKEQRFAPPQGVSAAVAAALEASGMSTRQVQEASGGRLGRDTVSRIARGWSGSLTLGTLEALHQVLGVGWEDLLGDFELPDEAAQLSPDERAAVLAVVDAFLAARPPA